jgi:hypothetical protein
MRNWKKLIEDLTSAPRGMAADNGRMGLGMAIAMEAARRDPSTEVEDYLRRNTRTDGERHAPVV